MLPRTGRATSRTTTRGHGSRNVGDQARRVHGRHAAARLYNSVEYELARVLEADGILAALIVGLALLARHFRRHPHETTAAVARESSRAGARDECFGADADRVDRNHGDRFGDGAGRSMAS